MILFILMVIFPSKITVDTSNQIVFWNVGQGQWITVIDQKHCYHFDVGGEFFNIQKISESCSKKQNVVFYSHWDWDHMGLSLHLKKSVQHICTGSSPQGPAKNYKKTILNQIPICLKNYKSIRKLNFDYNFSKGDNDLSQIFIFKNKFLIPGDSTKKMEKIWSPQIKKIHFQWLSVSHHGSRTSTSEFFLRNAKIGQAIISARKRVYGHPHQEVLNRLKKFKIPTLRTEDSGNIKILTL